MYTSLKQPLKLLGDVSKQCNVPASLQFCQIHQPRISLHLQVTYKRLRETLYTLQKAGGGQHPGGGNLPDVLFGRAQPRFVANPPAWKPLNKSLDSSQVVVANKYLLISSFPDPRFPF